MHNRSPQFHAVKLGPQIHHVHGWSPRLVHYYLLHHTHEHCWSITWSTTRTPASVRAAGGSSTSARSPSRGPGGRGRPCHSALRPGHLARTLALLPRLHPWWRPARYHDTVWYVSGYDTVGRNSTCTEDLAHAVTSEVGGPQVHRSIPTVGPLPVPPRPRPPPTVLHHAHYYLLHHAHDPHQPCSTTPTTTCSTTPTHTSARAAQPCLVSSERASKPRKTGSRSANADSSASVETSEEVLLVYGGGSSCTGPAEAPASAWCLSGTIPPAAEKEEEPHPPAAGEDCSGCPTKI